MIRKLDKAVKLRESGNLSQANQMLTALVREYPDDAQVNYQCAWSYDVLGLEKEAVPYYERAIRLGLPAGDEREAYVGLGSTLREIGEYQKSADILRQGIRLFDDHAMRAFLSLSLYSQGENRDAVQLLLQLLLTTSADPRIAQYQKALSAYADALTEIEGA